MILLLQYVEKHGSIGRGEVAELCRLNPPQAYRVLKRLEKHKRYGKHPVRPKGYGMGPRAINRTRANNRTVKGTKVAHYYLAVNAMTKHMQVREDTSPYGGKS